MSITLLPADSKGLDVRVWIRRYTRSRRRERRSSFSPPRPRGARANWPREAVESGCDLILAAGGDGTINEVVNGIAGSDVHFGILPAGTANVLANEIGFSNRPDHAARQILHAVPVRIALGALQQPAQPRRYFVLMAGVGLDARIVYELDLDLKSKLGKLAYWHGGLRQFGRAVPRFHLTVEWIGLLRELRSDHTRAQLRRRFRNCATNPADRQRL